MKRHALITLVLIMCLTSLLDYASVRSESPQDRARRAAPGFVGETTIVPNPQFRKPVDNSPKYVDNIRLQAKLWFLQREHLDEWKCIDEIIYRESRWTVNAQNPTTSAFGLGQVKNSKPYTYNKPMKQFIRAIKYAIYRYGTLCNALEAHNRQGWY